MRVLMISKACVVGIYQRKLEEMARLGLDLLLVTPPVWNDPSGPVRLERAYTDGYRLAVEPLRFNGNFHLHYTPTLARHMRAFRPDIVHIDEEPYNLATWHALWLAKRSGARALFFSWQNIARRYPPPFSWGEAWALRNVQGALFGTQGAADVWAAKGYRGKSAVVPQFGVDPALFQPAERTRQPGGTPLIGFAGRLVPEKGVDLLIRAAAELAGSGLPVHLRIIGQGPERASLEGLAASLGISAAVEFAGPVSSLDMPSRLQELDGLVLPSRTLPNWKEQFGRVLIEAMACGVPVVASDSGAIPEVLDGVGWLFREGDASALAGQLRAMLSDTALRAQRQARGRVQVIKRFAHEQVARQTLAFYEKVVGEEPSPPAPLPHGEG
ncbi:MAG: glycosyltransferase family 4 protein [Anaerolineae bacterium]|nr:glycosyltransferase family 4 protein [Anaerolineae bacterium]